MKCNVYQRNVSATRCNECYVLFSLPIAVMHIRVSFQLALRIESLYVGQKS